MSISHNWDCYGPGLGVARAIFESLHPRGQSCANIDADSRMNERWIFDRSNIPHYHWCCKSLVAIYQLFTAESKSNGVSNS